MTKNTRSSFYQLGTELSDSWRFFNRNFGTIAYIAIGLFLPIFFLDIFFTHFYDSQVEEQYKFQNIVPMLSQMAFIISSVAIILYVSSVIKSNPINSHKAWELATLKIFHYLVFLVIYYLSVGVGLLLLLIPGLILIVRFSFVKFFLIIENQGIVDSFKMSWVATKEVQWRLLAGILIIYILTFSVSGFLATLIPEGEIELNLMQDVLSLAIALLFLVYFHFETVFVYRVYDGVLKSLNENT